MSILAASEASEDNKVDNSHFIESSLVSLLKFGIKMSSPDIVLFSTHLSKNSNPQYKDLRRQSIEILQKELENSDED